MVHFYLELEQVYSVDAQFRGHTVTTPTATSIYEKKAPVTSLQVLDFP